eukprot:scaffold322743_cov33-Prasinocladus_malaysianus.AAC.1
MISNPFSLAFRSSIRSTGESACALEAERAATPAIIPVSIARRDSSAEADTTTERRAATGAARAPRT